jgi:hypothetical protein
MEHQENQILHDCKVYLGELKTFRVQEARVCWHHRSPFPLQFNVKRLHAVW